ncbi:MAG: HEAT repeat domain-containing protein [Chloroflexota bacterium]
MSDFGAKLETELDAEWRNELDDDDEFYEPSPALTKRYSVAELMTLLVENPTELTRQDLWVLSDLSRADMDVVRRRWPEIPTDRRQDIVQSMVEMGAENLDLHLGRFLQVAMGDDDASIRRIAIEGLAEDVDTAFIGPLLQTFHNDSDESVRATAAAALGPYVLAGELNELASAFAMRIEEALLSVLLREDELLEVRCRALESIAYSSEVAIRQLIEDGYYSPFMDMRLSALRAMGRSADIRWRPLVKAELQNPDAEMRAGAAQACGELEARSALSDLMAMTEDEDQSVRLAAIFSLGRIGGAEVKRLLRELSNDDATLEGEAAEEALDEILLNEDNEGIALFDERLDSDDPDWDDDEDEQWDFEPWERWQ